MSADEVALTFPCGGETLVGVLSRAPAGTLGSGIGVVIVVGGPQYRAGAHRQFVQLARRLGAAGHAVLRFDVRGMGDSTGARRSFEELDDDIAAALAALRQAAPEVRRVVLWGLCDGASATLLYCARAGAAAGVNGLCVVNPWLRSEQSLARTHLKHHYWQRLKQRGFWRKLLRGEVALAAVRDLLASFRLAAAPALRRSESADHSDFRILMARGWHSFEGAMLLVISADDYTAREFLEGSGTLVAWRGAMSKPGLTTLNCVGADHTFSTATARTAMEEGVVRWLAQLAPGATPAPRLR